MGAAKVSITDIFRFPVLEQLAAHIEGPKAAPAAPPPVVAAPAVQGDSLAEAMDRRRAMRLARRGIDA